MQTNRLFEIIYILLNRKTVTAAELAARFEVSQRTIYRDIDVLSLAGVPVYTNKGKGGGICLLADFVLDKSVLSENEQNEILAALRGLAAARGTAADEVLGKLSAFFGKTSDDWIEVDFSNWGNKNAETFDILKNAVLGRQVLRFDYYSSYAEMTRREVEPLKLWFKHRAWYLKAYCRIRRDVRLFRLTRIRDPEPTGEVFRRRDLLASPSGSVPDESHIRRDIRMVLRIAPEMTYRVLDEFEDWQTIKNPDGSHTVAAVWPEDEWLYGFILSFGEYAEILEPERLKETIRVKLQKTLERLS